MAQTPQYLPPPPKPTTVSEPKVKAIGNRFDAVAEATKQITSGRSCRRES
jgi:hypothetical protein